MKSISNGKLQETNRADIPIIMMIFHPGKGMILDDVRRQLKDLDPDSQFTEIYLGSKKEQATLVLPLGVFVGKKRIQYGLAVLKNMVKYIV